ncbi:MAG: hypothetical protein SFX73_21820 [Kofleriaceae bacterium]|nr:hypothetical protein [Kofleriaceae bacterium]
MRLPTMFPAAIVAAVLGVACTSGGAYYSGGTTGVYATAVTPDLVTVSPGVSVIAGWNEPVFYSNNYYWRYYGNRWYRSPYYNRGWVYATPPYAVSRIDRPWTYRNYRPYGYTTGRYYNSGRYYNDRYYNNRAYNDRYRSGNYYNQQRYNQQRYQQQRYQDQRNYRGQSVYRDQGSYSQQRQYQGRQQRQQQQRQQQQRQRNRSYSN